MVGGDEEPERECLMLHLRVVGGWGGAVDRKQGCLLLTSHPINSQLIIISQRLAVYLLVIYRECVC